MTTDEAKRILCRYRPNHPEDQDEEVLLALRLAAGNRELQDWLAEYRTVDRRIREQFQALPVPRGLLAEIRVDQRRRRISHFGRRGALALSVAAVLLVSFFVLKMGIHPESQAGFAAYRERMARSVLRDYRMSLLSENLGEIRGYLRNLSGTTAWQLTPGLEKAKPVGCALLHWRNHPVSIVCFDGSQNGFLYLFMVASVDVPDAPASVTPVFVSIGKLSTASWSDNGVSYLLATRADPDFLKQQF
ncbi:MAG: hypothetical protein HYR88_15415 [Verrucomicrobia bacterium]|nr:hypothetical protein [Verrucomicrobiota bacterium]MBI3868305.1 hypothetical protein [Verrucomicrobiota bacterium]